MRKAIMVTCIIAAICLVIGAVLSFTALASIGFDFGKLNTTEMEHGEYAIAEDFSFIEIHAVSADVRLNLSEDDRCRVEYATRNGVKTSVENGVLYVHAMPTKLIDFIQITNMNEYVTLYLPFETYEELFVETTSGDVYIFPSFDSVKKATISSTSGDISFIGTVSDTLFAESTSGNVVIREPNAKTVHVETTSGEITLNAVYATNVSVETTSGDVNLDGVTAKEKLTASTNSGEIELYCDATELYLESTSGDIEGSIGSAKNYIVNTTSGRVRIPPRDQNAGVCEIHTTSGDIEIKTAKDPINSFGDD